MNRRVRIAIVVLASAVLLDPVDAQPESSKILLNFPRWVRCTSGSASWKQTAPGYKANLMHSAAFEISIKLPSGKTIIEPATGTGHGNYQAVESWNYVAAGSTGGFTLSRRDGERICYSHKFDGASEGFEMGGFPKGASFRYRDKDGKTVDVNY